jgi:hypothetical protein
LLFLSACKKDFLDTKIDTNATPETIITNRATLFNFANAFYASLPYELSLSSGSPFVQGGVGSLDNNLFGAASDEALQTNVSAPNVRPFNQGTLSPINVPSNVDQTYKTLYDGIRAANFFLQYSIGYKEFLLRNRDTTSVSAINIFREDSLNIAWYRGEAHIARAFYYTELLKRYGGVPIINTTLDQAATLDIPRTSFDSTVGFILSEIDGYKDSVQVNWKTSAFKGNDGRFTKGAALAIKSRVLLYAASPRNNAGSDPARWQRAAEAARELLTTTGLNLALFTGGYGNLFLGSNPIVSTNNEVIMAVRKPASNFPEQLNYPVSTPGGNTGITPSHNLVEAYEYTGAPNPANPYANRDPRLTATVVVNGSTWTGRVIDQSAGATDDMAKANASRTGYYLKKFLSDNLNLQQGGTAQHNWILFRYAEILLNYAEAMNEAYGADAQPTGYPMTARAALKLIRDRASTALPAVSAASGAGFRTAVKNERRVELAFEGHRYWDLLRWKDAETVLNQPVRGVRITKNVNNTFTYSVADVAARAFSTPMYFLPFSRAEIVNARGTLVQNPGY